MALELPIDPLSFADRSEHKVSRDRHSELGYPVPVRPPPAERESSSTLGSTSLCLRLQAQDVCALTVPGITGTVSEATKTPHAASADLEARDLFGLPGKLYIVILAVAEMGT